MYGVFKHPGHYLIQLYTTKRLALASVLDSYPEDETRVTEHNCYTLVHTAYDTTLRIEPLSPLSKVTLL